uniref:Dephospho-CoA kinase n=1 Tax=Eutreptiella gymnastica TaxID=73025 RepID=A0A7S1NID5_9EUGL
MNRTRLGEMIFASPKKRKQLNAITGRPIFYAVVRRILHEMFIARSDVVILDAPLLYETKVFQYFVKGVVVVYAKPHLQLQRLMDRNGYTRDEAQQRISSQMPMAEKVRRAQHVLDNSGEREELCKQVDDLYPRIQRLWPTGTHTLVASFVALAVTFAVQSLYSAVIAPHH